MSKKKVTYNTTGGTGYIPASEPGAIAQTLRNQAYRRVNPVGYTWDNVKSFFGKDRQRLFGDPNAKEWVPNPDHPVAAKYKDAFMQANRHGKFPEETWANYMGSKATNMSWNDFRYDNAHREGIYPPIGFIKDYKQHLIDTYKPMSLYYNP